MRPALLVLFFAVVFVLGSPFDDGSDTSDMSDTTDRGGRGGGKSGGRSGGRRGGGRGQKNQNNSKGQNSGQSKTGGVLTTVGGGAKKVGGAFAEGVAKQAGKHAADQLFDSMQPGSQDQDPAPEPDATEGS